MPGTEPIKAVRLLIAATSRATGDPGMPWEMWAYFGLGLVVAYWYQQRGERSVKDQGLRAE